MSEYSEKQLLLLSNYIYLPCSLSDLKVSELLDLYRAEDGTFTEESVARAGVGGGMTNSEVQILFSEMDKEAQKSEEFANLSPARKLNDGHVRAVLYTDSQDKNPVAVFRGTGGSQEAWTDNFEGGYETDTKCQKLAADFIDKECSVYSDITVTGHSKGGNMSQYVTVMCAERIGGCISFDGQGFCNDFIRENQEKVSLAAGKIKSISAYNDFVNILLTTIAAEAVFVNNGDTIKDAHSSLSLLINNEYDEKGNIVSLRNQSASSMTLKKVTDGMVNIIDDFDDPNKRLTSFIMGKTISSALCMESKDQLAEIYGSLSGGILATMVTELAKIKMALPDENAPVILNTYIDVNKTRFVSARLSDHERRIGQLKQEIASVSEKISMNIASKIYGERKLCRVNEEIDKIMADLNMLSTNLDMIIIRYENMERRNADLFTAG